MNQVTQVHLEQQEHQDHQEMQDDQVPQEMMVQMAVPDLLEQ
ncbi:hypothetical protein [Salmonella sp. s51944]